MNPFIINLKINEGLFLRDPQTTKLGKRIIENSVLLIDELGLEQFNFKKLAKQMESTEASIYRYFENKHNLFVYLLNWYWEWMIVRIDLNTMNITDAKQRMKIILDIIIDTAKRNTEIEFVDEEILHKIVVTEGAKGYHNKLVDADNKEGFFLSYKSLCSKIADCILEINPLFPYPKTLASTLIETANNNIYFAKHLPRLTDLDEEGDHLMDDLKKMLEFFAFNLIQTKTTGRMATLSQENKLRVQ